VDCHVAKVAQSASAMWRISFQISKNVGPRTFFEQIFFCRDIFQIFFFVEEKTKSGPNYRDGNHI